MSSDQGLESKILDRSLSQHESAQNTLFRDLKIAAVLLLAFQFIVFFRFVDLNDQRLRIDQKMTPLRDDQVILSQGQAQITSLYDDLEMGKETLIQELKEAPSIKREKILALQDDVEALRAEPSFDSPIQQGSRRPEFLQGLSDAEINILKTGQPDERVYDDLLKDIVENVIIVPAFAALNSRKSELLGEPFEEGKRRLVGMLRLKSSTFAKYGLDTNEMENELLDVEKSLNDFQFAPPDSPLWWTTFASKVAGFQAIAIDTEKVVDGVEEGLLATRVDIEALGGQLATLIEKAEAEKKTLTADIQELDSDYNQVQSLLESYAGPLPVVALDAKDAVVYYPVVLAAVFVYLVWRYLLLQVRARALAVTYQRLGLSAEVIRAYLGFPGFIQIGESNGLLRGYMPVTGLVLLCAVPAVFLAVSVYLILDSPALRGDAPRALYMVVGSLVILSYLILGWRILRSAQDHQS